MADFDEALVDSGSISSSYECKNSKLTIVVNCTFGGIPFSYTLSLDYDGNSVALGGNSTITKNENGTVSGPHSLTQAKKL